MIRALVSSSSRHILARNFFFPAAATTSCSSKSCHRFLDTDANQKALDDFLSSLSPPRRKMFDILNDYRTKNYSQSTNKRFIKTMISAIDANNDNVITREEYQALLKNIGAEEQMSEEELDSIFEELGVGEDEKVIPVELIEKSWEPLVKIVIPN